jgi:hypothetical protein
MKSLLPCLLYAHLFFQPNLPPVLEELQVERDEQSVGLPAADRTGQGLVRFVRAMTLSEEARERVQQWIADLGDEDFLCRDRATSALLAKGPSVLPLLRPALRGYDAERMQRAGFCVAALEAKLHRGRIEATLRLLERRRPQGSVPVLLGYLPHACDAGLGDEALATLIELARGDSTALEVCGRTLTSSHAAIRGGAGLVIGYFGSAEQKLRAAKLLGDSDATVRYLAAVGLGCRGDRDALAVLANLIAEPAPLGWKAERALRQLVGSDAPGAAWSSTVSVRHESRSVWDNWLQSVERTSRFERVDLAQEFSPTRQAQACAKQFIDAVVTCRPEGIKSITSVPFFVSGVTTFRTADETHQAFVMALTNLKKRPRALKLEARLIVRGEDYLAEAPEEERAFLAEVTLDNIRAVLINVMEGDVREQGVLLLRFDQGQVHVVGYGRWEK